MISFILHKLRPHVLSSSVRDELQFYIERAWYVLDDREPRFTNPPPEQHQQETCKRLKLALDQALRAVNEQLAKYPKAKNV